MAKPVVFRPNAKLDPSQVVDMRAPTPMDYVRFEDGSGGFVTDPNTGARLPSANGRLSGFRCLIRAFQLGIDRLSCLSLEPLCLSRQEAVGAPRLMDS